MAGHELITDKSGKELHRWGTSMFPCEFFRRTIQEYATGDIPPHWHGELEVFQLVEGRVSVVLSDQTVELKAGEGYFTNANILHWIRPLSDTRCEYRSVVFDPAIVSGMPGSVFDALYLRPFLEDGVSACALPEDSPVLKLLREACRIDLEREDGYEFALRDLFSKMLLELRDRPKPKVDPSTALQEERMKLMLSWVDAHLFEPVTVAQISEAAGVCVRECQRTFSALLHCSPVQYLVRQRVSAAAELLRSSDLPIIEIGTRCGFDSASYFAKQFRALTGMTPREYRNRAEKEGTAEQEDREK